MTNLNAWAARRSMKLRPLQLPSGQWVWEDPMFSPSDLGTTAPDAAQAVADHINGLRGEVDRLGRAHYDAGLRYAALQDERIKS